MNEGGSRNTAGSLGSAIGVAALGLGAAAAAGSLAWGALVERNAFTVRHESVPILAPGSRSVTVLHLSDLHMAPWQRAKQEWVRSLAALEPDLIVNTGDNLGHQNGLEGLEKALSVFRGVPGVFVNGSNDYFGPVIKNPFIYFAGPSAKRLNSRSAPLDTAALETYFASLGWLDLNNTARAMTIRGNNIEFFGVDDPHIGRDRLDKLPGALDDLRENVDWWAPAENSEPGAPGASGTTGSSGSGKRAGGRRAGRARPRVAASGAEPTVIALAHAPYRRVLNSLVTNGADIIFAGHTHGGQVCVPGVGALVTNCDIPRDQVRGLSTWSHALKSAPLNVSAGLGTSIYAPVRFACKPEAVLLTLTAADFG